MREIIQQFLQVEDKSRKLREKNFYIESKTRGIKSWTVCPFHRGDTVEAFSSRYF